MKRVITTAGSMALLASVLPAAHASEVLHSELTARAQIEAAIRQSLEAVADRDLDRLMLGYAPDFQERTSNGETKNYDQVRSDAGAFINTLLKFPNRSFRFQEFSANSRTATAVVLFNLMADTREPNNPVMRLNNQMRVRYNFTRVGENWLLQRAEVLEQHPIVHNRW